jgi:hypothetical protein
MQACIYKFVCGFFFLGALCKQGAVGVHGGEISRPC